MQQIEIGDVVDGFYYSSDDMCNYKVQGKITRIVKKYPKFHRASVCLDNRKEKVMTNLYKNFTVTPVFRSIVESVIDIPGFSSTGKKVKNQQDKFEGKLFGDQA
jgi:hypothetical protein